MQDDDRADVVAAMYQQAHGAAEAEAPPSRSASGGSRTRRIRVGIVEYEVPTPEYVQQLEQAVAQQGQLISQQRRAIERLSQAMKAAQGTHHGTVRDIEDLRRELSKKISHGGAP